VLGECFVNEDAALRAFLIPGSVFLNETLTESTTPSAGQGPLVWSRLANPEGGVLVGPGRFARGF
jgi:hypothetical protein